MIRATKVVRVEQMEPLWPPMNTMHRLVNGSREPVEFLAVTNAPIAFDIYRDANFIFNYPYSFADRFHGKEDYFNIGRSVR